MDLWVCIVIAAVCVLVTAVVTALATTSRLKKSSANTIGNAEEKAREIIDEALKTADSKKRESMLEIKEETIRAKNELDKEFRHYGKACTEAQKLEVIANVAKRAGYTDVDDFYNNIGYGGVAVSKFAGKLKDEFDRIVAPLFKQVQKLRDKCTLAAEARDRLLPKLMNGEIEV